MKAGAMTLGAMIALTACANGPRTTATTAPSSRAATTSAGVDSSSAPSGSGAALAVRECVNALGDDPSDPGAHFVEQLQKLSVGYPMVELLTAAQELCSEAGSQLEAESADLLADTDTINAALDLAAQQIRMDAFYLGGSVPPQFIPDGAMALRQSIQAFYSKTLVASG